MILEVVNFPRDIFVAIATRLEQEIALNRTFWFMVEVLDSNSGIRTEFLKISRNSLSFLGIHRNIQKGIQIFKINDSSENFFNSNFLVIFIEDFLIFLLIPIRFLHFQVISKNSFIKSSKKLLRKTLKSDFIKN